jgi:hypothetical protein
MQAYNTTCRLAGRSMITAHTIRGIQFPYSSISKPTGYYRANGAVVLRAYSSHSNILLNANNSQQLANDDNKPCKDDSSLNLDNKLVPELNLPSTPTFAPSRLNGRRRRRRILSHGGNDNNDNNNSNNTPSSSSTAMKSTRNDITTNHKEYLQLAVTINDQTIQKCWFKQTEKQLSTQNWLHLAPKRFCKELTLVVKAALRSNINPANAMKPVITSNQSTTAWHNIRDHIALRPSTRNTTPLLMNTVQETAKELDIDVCQLNPWILQELFDPLIPSSGNYTRNNHLISIL